MRDSTLQLLDAVDIQPGTFSQALLCQSRRESILPQQCREIGWRIDRAVSDICGLASLRRCGCGAAAYHVQMHRQRRLREFAAFLVAGA
jgi:hypothetical protein